MKYIIITISLLSFSLLSAQKNEKIKQKSLQFLDQKSGDLFQWSDSIWSYSEPSFKEFKSSTLIKSILKAEGFSIEENVCGTETMFIASFGSGKPVVGVLAEYDADHKLIKPDFQVQLPNSEYGHGAGHNLLGVGCLGGVLSIKKLMEKGKLKGTIRYYGSTAEGGLGGRVYMTRDGYFNDLDLSVFWHPSPVNSVNLSKWDAIIDTRFILKSKKLEGIEEQDIMQQVVGFLTDINKLNSNDDDQLILKYNIDSNVKDLSINTDSVSIQIRIEHPDQITALKILSQLNQLIDNYKNELNIKSEIFRAVHEAVPNKLANDLAFNAFKYLGKLPFIEKDENQAEEVYKYLQKQSKPLMKNLLPYEPEKHQKTLYGYGSDIGDVSWKAPQLSFVAACLPLGISMSNWEGTYFTGHEIGKKGMLYASKVMTIALIDYYTSQSAREGIRKEYLERTRHYQYQPLIPKGSPKSEKNSKRSR